MYPISGEIYSKNVTIDIFYNSGLTQSWNIVHQNPILLLRCDLRNILEIFYSLQYNLSNAVLPNECHNIPLSLRTDFLDFFF